MSDDTIREFEPPGAEDVERFSDFRTTLVEKFRLSDEHATRLAFALSERHPALAPSALTAARVAELMRELSQDDELEAELRKRIATQN